MLMRALRQLWTPRRKAAEASAAAAAVQLLSEGRTREAEEMLRRACAAAPNDVEAWRTLGYIRQISGSAGDAVDAYERAVALESSNAELHFGLASAYRAAGELRRAADSLGRAAELRPLWHAPVLSLADLHASAGEVDAAQALYESAIRIAPEIAETHYNFGNLLLRCGLAPEAVRHYRKAVELQPSFARAYSNYLCALNYAGEEPPERIRDAHLEFDARYARALAPMRQPARPRRERIRVGYVSPDFRDHAVGRLVEPALRHHDREKFEVCCYSDVTQPDARTERFRRYAHAWRDIAPMNDDAVAAAIRDDGIDILVDLAGHTEGHRLLVFARKPAPVQVTWIGYPNTTGLAAMDYRISDANADPPGMTEHLHSEKLLRLPEIYLPCEAPEEAVDAGPPPCETRGHVTFGSFNTLMKIGPRAIALWGRVLGAVPQSRLVMITVPEGRTRERIRMAFAQHGVAADRIELRGRLPHAEFLATHAAVDIALDSWPYHGTTTTMHTLWMGVPVLTLAGATHVSRVGVTMLANAGLGDLVATSEDDYVERAVQLANDRHRLTAIRAMLRERMERGPAMDGARFTRHLEAAYASIWSDHLNRNA